MSDNGTEFNTPVGRIVKGHPLEPRDKMKDGLKVLKEGQPIKQYVWHVAFTKPEFEQQIWPHLAAETAKMFPSGVPPKYSYKYKDGDSGDPVWFNGKQTKPLNQRTGYPGHYILTVSTELQAPSVVRFDSGIYKEVLPNQIKCGDYVAMTIIAKVHAGESPGLYINPGVVVHAFEGDAIADGGMDIDPTQSFGAAPQFAMPAGARPLGAPAPVGGGMPGAAPGGMPAYAPPAAAQPQYAPQPAMAPAGPAAMPGQMPPPAHDFVQNAGMMPGGAPAGMPGQMPGGMPLGAMPGPR